MDELGSVPIGRRIHVVGNSCSGKSVLGKRLAAALQVPFVELDALNWRPGWVGLNETDPQRFESLIEEATAGDAWVVAGSYMSFSQRVFMAAIGDRRLAGSAHAPARMPRAPAVVDTLAVEGTAVGHESRAVLAPADGLEQGGLPRLVDRYPAPAETPRHAPLHLRAALAAHPVLASCIIGGSRGILTCTGLTSWRPSTCRRPPSSCSASWRRRPFAGAVQGPDPLPGLPPPPTPQRIGTRRRCHGFYIARPTDRNGQPQRSIAWIMNSFLLHKTGTPLAGDLRRVPSGLRPVW